MLQRELGSASNTINKLLIIPLANLLQLWQCHKFCLFNFPRYVCFPLLMHSKIIHERCGGRRLGPPARARPPALDRAIIHPSVQPTAFASRPSGALDSFDRNYYDYV